LRPARLVIAADSSKTATDVITLHLKSNLFLNSSL